MSANAALQQLVPMLGVDQVAELCRCTPETIRDLASAGELPGEKLGRDWVFPAGPLYEALCRRAEAAATHKRAKGGTAKQPGAVLKAVAGGKRTPPPLPPSEERST